MGALGRGKGGRGAPKRGPWCGKGGARGRPCRAQRGATGVAQGAAWGAGMRHGGTQGRGLGRGIGGGPEGPKGPRVGAGRRLATPTSLIAG